MTREILDLYSFHSYFLLIYISENEAILEMTIISINLEKGTLLPGFNSNSQVQRMDPQLTSFMQNNDFNCCQTPEIIETRGLYVCRNCGLDYGSALKDHLSYDQKNDIIKTNKNIILPFQYGARTIFTCENLAPSKKAKFQRLAKLNQFYFNSYEHNMTLAYRYLFIIASQLQIPSSIMYYAFQIYIKVIKRGLTIGRNIKYLTIASLFIASDQYKYSCSLKHLSDISQIPEKVIRKNYRLILHEFQIKLNNHSVAYYLLLFCVDLGLSIQFQSFALKFLKSFLATKENPNLNPKALAIVTIYTVSKKYMREKRVTQEFLSIISNISEVTIRKYLKIIEKISSQEKGADLNSNRYLMA